MRQRSSLSSVVVHGAAILGVAAVLLYGNGGIGIGSSNHVGLLPVVRRMLDANYLPGDFNVNLRLFHHRVFALVVANVAALLGEDRALIGLRVVGMVGMSLALWTLSRVVGLSLLGFLAVGGFVATEFLWTGRGLELNNFLGDPEIMPPLFAHTLTLFAIAAVIKERYRLAVVLVGLTVLFHLQIGITLALMLAPLHFVKLKTFGVKETGLLAGLFLIPAAPAIWHIMHMLQRGLAGTPVVAAYYINFRHPHHFELLSWLAVVGVGAHLLVLALAYWRWKERAIGVMLAVSVTCIVLSLVHFVDYYLVKHDKLAQIQFLRLTPTLTVLGAIGAIWVLNRWAREGWRAWLLNALLIGLATAWGVYAVKKLDANYYFGVRRYTEEQNGWGDVCRWVKANGAQTVYLTPPGRSGFTSLTDRSMVAEFKLNPDAALGQAEWFERLRDLSGGKLPDGHGTENRKLLDRAFASLKEEQLQALGAKYKAELAVLPKASKVGLEVVYKNAEYRVVKLNAVRNGGQQ